jgi:hypothetical protein
LWKRLGRKKEKEKERRKKSISLSKRVKRAVEVGSERRSE